MPRRSRSKRSKAAKRTRQNARATFAAPASHTASPGGSEYVISDNGSDGSGMDLKSSDESDIQGGNSVKASMEALQRLYSTILPPHLRVRLEENEHTKRRKMDNRKAVYTGDSRTTVWRKNAALKRAADGCMTLDAFLVRTVCHSCVEQWRSLILIRSGRVALRRLR